MNDIFIKTEKSNDSYSKRDLSEPSLEELERRREARKLEQENNPHYLKGSFKTTSYHNSSNVYEEFENIPVAELDIPISLKISNLHRCQDINIDNTHKRHKKHEKKKKSKKSKSNCPMDNMDYMYMFYNVYNYIEFNLRV